MEYSCARYFNFSAAGQAGEFGLVLAAWGHDVPDATSRRLRHAVVRSKVGTTPPASSAPATPRNIRQRFVCIIKPVNRQRP
jgi:hypothetical protein